MKKESDKDCNNYRYVSVVNSVGRVLSRVMKKHNRGYDKSKDI
jgi:hypothetical protein